MHTNQSCKPKRYVRRGDGIVVNVGAGWRAVASRKIRMTRQEALPSAKATFEIKHIVLQFELYLA